MSHPARELLAPGAVLPVAEECVLGGRYQAKYRHAGGTVRKWKL